MKLHKDEYVIMIMNRCNKERYKKGNHSKPRRKKNEKKKVIEPIVPISYYSTSGQHTSGHGEISCSPTPSSSPPHHPLPPPRHHRRPPLPVLAMPSASTTGWRLSYLSADGLRIISNNGGPARKGEGSCSGERTGCSTRSISHKDTRQGNGGCLALTLK